MVLDPQASLVVKKQTPSISNEQAPSNVSSGLQQEAQGPKESATDLSKLSSAMHDSLPSAEGNNRSLISDQVKVDPHFSLQKQAKHVVHFNPTFEENSFVNVEVKEGVLEARNHSAVVFKNRNILEPVSEETGGSGPSTGIKLPREVFKRQNAKVTGSEGGWKLNKTLKGPRNRFKNFENIRVPFADSMKRAVELIASEIDGKSAMDLSRQKGERAEFSSTAFREYNNQHKLDIFSLLEPRISGTKADTIIAKLGWDKSYRVKAVEFSRGIWIGWKNSIGLEVIGNHPQFILSCICSNLHPNRTFVAFVYGSPNKLKRKILWNDLSRSIPLGYDPWMAIGDFNAILSSDDKKGSHVKGRRCQFFGEFMDKAQLHDLGFQGPLFTWHRVNLSERLDRAV
ncbi:hypothetical protein Golob_019314, partial [Gossypium lobatum]|nr:hypothetical protein [Gossypium lobatum]